MAARNYYHRDASRCSSSSARVEGRGHGEGSCDLAGKRQNAASTRKETCNQRVKSQNFHPPPVRARGAGHARDFDGTRYRYASGKLSDP